MKCYGFIMAAFSFHFLVLLITIIFFKTVDN